MKIQNSIYPYSQYYPHTNTAQNYQRNKTNNLQFTLDKDICTFQGNTIDLLNFNPAKITEVVKEAILKNEILGWGSEGTVYKIQNSDYCVKVPDLEYAFWNWTNKITPQDKLNHIVAKSTNGVVIMNFIPGKKLPVQNKPDELYCQPIDTYRKFLIQLTNAHNVGLECDVTPSNTIFNPINHTLTQIDFKFSSIQNNEQNQHLVNAFSLLHQLIPNSSIARKQNNQLFLNLTQATLEELRPNIKGEISAKDIDFQSFYEKYQRTMHNIVLPKQYDILNKTMKEAIILKYHCEKLTAEQNPELLTAKINFAQSLINQLRKTEF